MTTERLEQLERDGHRHALCNHPDALDGLTAEEAAAYTRGQERGIAEWEAHQRAEEQRAEWGRFQELRGRDDLTPDEDLWMRATADRWDREAAAEEAAG